MRKSILIAAMALFAAMSACTGGAGKNEEQQYEVMSPWAEADPIPLRGISSRIDALDGKKIGLFANFKRSAVPQARMLEKKLKGKIPTIQTDLYHAPNPDYIAQDSPEWGKFSAWIKSVDAIVLMVGD